MKKGLTEIVFILDRSGSMGGLESDTIGGYNSLIDKQKKEEGEAIVSTVLFDDRVEFLHDRISLDKINPMTDKDYYVRGCTALLDAMGMAIHYVKKAQKHMNEEERPEKTLFIITTDGQENSSKKYTYDKVKKMIEKRKVKGGWEFLFLGANIDAIEEANKFGIAKERAVNFKCDKKGTAINYRVLGETLSKVRSCSADVMCEALSSDWKKEIEEDYKSRN